MSEMTVPENKMNSRELSFYLLIGTIAVFFTLITSLSIWFFSATGQPSTMVSLGQVSDLSFIAESGEAQPYRVQIEDPAYVWVANVDGELRVYSPFTTMRWLTNHGELGCRFTWSTSAGRFEDPCSGSKYRLDGVIIGGPATRDLDYYTATIENDGEIWIDTSQLFEGQCRQLYTGPATQISYKVWDETPPVCDQS